MADMAAVHRLKATEARTPQRTVLADRIAQARSADARSAAVSSAYQTAQAAVFEAQRKLEAAEAGVAQSSSTPPRSWPTWRRGRLVRDHRRSSRHAAIWRMLKTTWQRLALRAICWPSRVQKADSTLGNSLLRDAAINVIRSEAVATAASLVNEVGALQAALAEKAATLEWLAGADVFPRGGFGGVAGPAAPVMARLSTPPNTWAGLSAEQHAGRDVWETALERLMTDATSQLP
jgi:hypothetical protein